MNKSIINPKENELDPIILNQLLEKYSKEFKITEFNIIKKEKINIYIQEQ